MVDTRRRSRLSLRKIGSVKSTTAKKKAPKIPHLPRVPGFTRSLLPPRTTITRVPRRRSREEI